MKKVFFLLFSIAGLLKAQNVHKQAEHTIMNLQQCIDFAIKHNENLKTADLEIQYQRQFKKAATEVPKTNVSYMQGQFNSIYKYDNSVTITQQIPFPAVFTAHNALAKSYIKGSEFKFAATKADLIYQVKSTYYALLYYHSIQNLLGKEDSIYQSFAKAGKLKYESGEGSLLEKTTAETKVMEIKNQLLENDEDINGLQIQLQTLLNSDAQIDIIDEDLTKKTLTINPDSSGMLSHPYILYLHEQIIAGRKNRLLELYKIFPDFQAGYFNLSIYGPADIGNGPYRLTTQNRLQGLTFGLNIPLWFYPQSSKIKAAQINTDVAQSNYNYNLTMFGGQFSQSYTLYLKYQNSLNFYRSSALINSQLILKQALKSYETGEISYIDYLTVVSHALDLESNYLNVINQNNLTVLKLEYLLYK